MYSTVSMGQIRAIETDSMPAEQKDVADAIRSTIVLHDCYADEFQITVHEKIAELCTNLPGQITPAPNGVAVSIYRPQDDSETPA